MGTCPGPDDSNTVQPPPSFWLTTRTLKDSERYQYATDEISLHCTERLRRGGQREQTISIPKAANVPTGIEVTCLLGNALICFSWTLESGVSNQIKGKHASFVLCSRLCESQQGPVGSEKWELGGVEGRTA